MSVEENKAIARRYWEESWNTGNLASLEEIFAPDHLFHTGAGQVVRGTQERGMMRFRTAFPDLHFVIEDVFAEGDKVVVRWTAHGTHRGDIQLVQNIPATGKQVTWLGMDIYHLTGGKIMETWRSWDRLGLLQQLSVVPASA